MMRRIGTAAVSVMLLAACRSSPAPAPSEPVTSTPPVAPSPAATASPPLTTAPPSPPVPPPDLHCKRDAECVITTFYVCCTESAPHAARKDVDQQQQRACENAGCIDIEHIEMEFEKKNFIAKCVSGTCTAIDR